MAHATTASLGIAPITNRSARISGKAWPSRPPPRRVLWAANVRAKPFDERLMEIVAGALVELPADADFGALLSQTIRHPSLRRVLDEIWVRTQTPDPHISLWTDAAILQISAVLLELRSKADTDDQKAQRSRLGSFVVRPNT